MSENNYSDVLNKLLEKYISEGSKESSNEAPSNETQPNDGSIHTDANTDNSSKTNEPNSEDNEKQTIKPKVGTATVKQRAKLEDEIDRNFSNSPDAHARDQKLKEKSGEQTLESRKELIRVLKRLFSLQLFFMNAVILSIAIWTVLDLPFLRDIDVDIYNNLCSFIKYYVSAVLVEILGAIIFIVHKVFSDKYYD